MLYCYTKTQEVLLLKHTYSPYLRFIPTVMSNFLEYLQIHNFKSIQSLRMDCKRVNILIGKPNVGKSNILEALSLLGTHYTIPPLGSNKVLEFRDLVRYDELSNWFYDEDLARTITINADKINLQMQLLAEGNLLNFMLGDPNLIKTISEKKLSDAALLRDSFYNIAKTHKHFYATPICLNINVDGNGNGPLPPKEEPLLNPIKPFHYREGHSYSGKSADFLHPPFGDNLFGVVDRDRNLRLEIADLFKELGLDFVLSRKDGKFELQKNIDGIVYKYPYTGIADTFKRLVFYLSAIESNRDSVLILEEPEVHAFPPYTKQLADRIALSEENQFFLSTHSPYLLNTLVETLGDDELSVTLVYFKNYETKIHTLSPDELREVQDFSIDVFFNLDKFIKDEAVVA